MKKCKRWISAVMMLCIIASMIPMIPRAAASSGATYVLDTDGIDYGEEYLIVANVTAGTYALSGVTPGGTTKVTVDGDTVSPFEGDTDYTWVFEDRGGGKVAIEHNGSYINIPTSSGALPSYQSSPADLLLANKSAGGYGIYVKSSMSYYLYGASDGSQIKTSFTFGTTYITALYLYKKVGGQAPVTTYNLSFNGNGNTAGTVPGAVDVEVGQDYTFQSPSDDFVMDWNGNTYLFWCWTEYADGSGTKYFPGDTITPQQDMVFYAQWYLQTKYTVTVVMDLDDEPTDVDKILGTAVKLYIRQDKEGAPFLELNRFSEGVYTATVTENGTYVVYAQYGDEEPEAEHGHKVIVFNQDGVTELLNYSVTYDLNGGTFENQEDPSANYHANTRILATEQIPVKEGHRFLGWEDQKGNLIAPGALVTDALLEKTRLTAKWEALVDGTVHIQIIHTAANGQVDYEENREELSVLLLQTVNGVSQPYGEALNLDETHDSFRQEGNITYYTVNFNDLPQAVYSIGCEKSHYTTTLQPISNRELNLVLTYAPDTFDLQYQVKVNMGNIPESLKPQAINVRVTRWEDGRWQDVEKFEGATPTTIFLDENGEGSGFLPVLKAGDNETYMYRVRVSSFIMPDGSVIHADSALENVTYVPRGSGLYSAQVSVPDGQAPAGSDVLGAYWVGNAQVGIPTVNVFIHPYTVTFDAGNGTLNGKDALVLNNQYQYPDLNRYIPVSNVENGIFEGWLINGQPAENLAGQFLTENVTYTAKYFNEFTIHGTVYAGFTYQQDGDTVTMLERDRAQNVRVILQKNINGVYNDVDIRQVTITYPKEGDFGTGTYTFADIPHDGTTYRVIALIYNYDVAYDNESDNIFSAEEFVVTENHTVDVKLTFSPDFYAQNIIIDSSAIESTFRPQEVTAQVLYRDLGDTHPYDVISQHSVGEKGIRTAIDNRGFGYGSETVWNWHHNGTLYEYQLDVTRLYGQVQDVFTPEGVDFSEKLPFTVRYDMPSYYINPAEGTQTALKATLVPKDYKIIFDMNLEGDKSAKIQGMEQYQVDNDNEEQYAFFHTWSYSKQFTAFPHREGYVFLGWESDHDGVLVETNGYVYVGAELAEDITLTAKWQRLKGTDYTVRHLEMNTNKVLLGDQIVTGSLQGATIEAFTAAESIEGYVYTGALIGDTYKGKNENPVLVLSNDPTKNVITLYYLPDGSDGFTEQVESNIYLNKDAVLENNGTYTITMETYTKDNPITTQIKQDTPLDIVLVLDQSGSIQASGSLNDLKESVNEFISMIASHGRENEVDHRMAVVGYASDEDGGYTKPEYPTAGKGENSTWVNTGVFDSNGDFHIYPVTGFNYTLYTGEIDTGATYYTYSAEHNEYLLMTFHKTYYHLISESDARKEVLNGTDVYGYVTNIGFVKLTRNTSGLWLYGNKQLYSNTDFFTYHVDVWTHRHGTEAREIHAYMINGQYVSTSGHEGVYTREETRNSNPDKSIYADALIPVSMSANGAGNIAPGLQKLTDNIGANGRTYVSYGMEMANSIFEANPTNTEDGRVRIVVVFTDGKPGDSSTFDETESNKAIAEAYITTHTYGADIYTVGVYGDDVVDAESDQDYFMNGLSSNYPDAQNLDDVWMGTTFQTASSGYRLDNGGPYYVQVNGKYYTLSLTVEYVSADRLYYNCWGYTNSSGDRVIISRTPVANGHPVITSGAVGGYTIYRRTGDGYKPTENSGYYTVAENSASLVRYFRDIVTKITTKITTQIILHDDTIMRDIMGQGLVLTPGTQVIAYKQAGTYNEADGTIIWSGVNEEVARVTIPENPAGTLYSEQTTNITYTLPDGTQAVKPNTPYITVYNLDSPNPTNPGGTNYHPHTVDVTGYDFTKWYISEKNPNGYKMVVVINRVEARDDVSWGRAQDTNQDRSGLWLPQDAQGNRELLLAFDQPSTIFVERAYVLDYGKEFQLSGWYFDDSEGKQATAIHLDSNIENGMNWFDPQNPTKENGDAYGNTEYGNVRIENGNVYYAPTTTQWGGYDDFYIFGNTWRQTVTDQDANENGNLWNKVIVVPANNIYYEDTFVTGSSNGVNDISGFVYTGGWTTVYTDDKESNAGHNRENPEHLEGDPYGDVHGWTDALDDDTQYSDGSAHGAGLDGKMGARAEFSFTGTGVDVYTRTNQKSGIVVAMLSGIDNAGKPVNKSIAMDNLAMSGDYYQIPTLSFTGLPYGTYKVTLIATAGSPVVDDGNDETDDKRYEYYLDGIRVYNPLGNIMNAMAPEVRDAYGKELNAVFTEVRDIMLTNNDFTPGLAEEGALGAVFIDWIQEGQETGEDVADIGTVTYQVGTTFNTYGPKNEVYLTKGQAVVIKVDPQNTYYVGMKSLTADKAVKVNLSGLAMQHTTTIIVSHTTDLYYEVTPIGEYIVIQNASEDGALLSLTKLRTTNMYASTANSGVLPITEEEALLAVAAFDLALEEVQQEQAELDANLGMAETILEQNKQNARALFTTVRTWLDDETGGAA